jgi:hypothetical protein
MNHLWSEVDGKLVHPNSPAHPSGAAHFQLPGPLTDFGNASGSLPHPHAMAARTSLHNTAHARRAPRAGFIRFVTARSRKSNAMMHDQTIRLSLRGVDKLDGRLKDELVWQMRRQFGPLVEAAGKRLVLIVGAAHHADLSLDFNSDLPRTSKCGWHLMGDDGTGDVDIGQHQDWRVCGPTDPRTGHRDRRIVLGTARLLARALANTAMHELGHFVADLPDLGGGPENLTNYMTTVEPPTREKTMASMRRWLAGPQHFSAEQQQRVIEHLRSGNFFDPLHENDP